MLYFGLLAYVKPQQTWCPSALGVSGGVRNHIRQIVHSTIHDAVLPTLQYVHNDCVLMQPVLLRRTKTSTIDGEPVVKLPPREQQLVRKAFSASEQRFYDQVQEESMQKLKVKSSAAACILLLLLLSSLLLLLLLLCFSCHCIGFMQHDLEHRSSSKMAA